MSSNTEKATAPTQPTIRLYTKSEEFVRPSSENPNLSNQLGFMGWVKRLHDLRS